MLKERQKSILDALVLEHIRTARPVASRELVKEFDFEISPATIRSEMYGLDELGYIEQPYTSSGRVPTDKGYRFFVDDLAKEFRLSPKERAEIDETFKLRDESEFLRELTRTIAGLAKTFTAGSIIDRHLFCKNGFSEMLAEPEFQDTASARAFGDFVDCIEDEAENLFEKMDDLAETVFIGSENPVLRARSYTMFLSSWQHPRGFNGFIIMTTPRRTNYSKHKALVRYIKQKNAKTL